jgi:hypothetical protein
LAIQKISPSFGFVHASHFQNNQNNQNNARISVFLHHRANSMLQRQRRLSSDESVTRAPSVIRLNRTSADLMRAHGISTDEPAEARRLSTLQRRGSGAWTSDLSLLELDLSGQRYRKVPPSLAKLRMLRYLSLANNLFHFLTSVDMNNFPTYVSRSLCFAEMQQKFARSIGFE